MAVRGLQAYAVPSARAGQQPDPSARRDVLSGLLTAGFLLAVISVVLLIIIAAPEYAAPAAGAGAEAPAALVASADASPGASHGTGCHGHAHIAGPRHAEGLSLARPGRHGRRLLRLGG